MSVADLFYIFVSGLPFGFLVIFIWNHFEKNLTLQKTKTEGEHILQTAKEQAETTLEKQKKEFNLLSQNKLQTFEKEKEGLVENIKKLQINMDKKIHQLKLKRKETSQLLYKIKNHISQMQQARENNKKQINLLETDLQKQTQDEIQVFEKHFSINSCLLKEGMKQEMETTWRNHLKEELEKQEKQNKQNLQKDSLFILNLVLNRFDRIYCPERGISPVSFKTEEHLKRVIGHQQIYINEIEKDCGVDIVISKEDLQASIFGIDPVRRELGRITLKRLSKRNKIDKTSLQKIVKQSKKDLFIKIREDGQKICQKLKLKNVHPEVKNMMGALRYRYSFAQNQYFHCEEVGWLCGLLNAELSMSIKPAQRAGMFHDIGKAMDHSIEGSHAVIGAEFLSKYKEKEEILHPVRAHHHDEPPSTILAHLVIVADAISGSRPGARRFTEDSYNQKMLNLERIIESFPHIEDAYIMSAGREMRVIVNNKKVNDKEALNLSQKIARKIEKECSYPGLIKVTVVRHSEKVAVV